MSHPNNKTTDKATADATTAFCADYLGDLDTSTDAVVEAGGWENGSPSGSAMLVVKRGPNAGSRFRLDQPVTSAGRHPDSDIVLDDVSISRRHAEFRRENGDYLVVDTRQPQRNLCQPHTGRIGGASQRRRDSDGQVPSGVPHPAHDALTSARITAIGRLRNARQTGCSRRHHATGPLRSSRWGATKPTDQTNHSRNIKSRLPETHVFL